MDCSVLHLRCGDGRSLGGAPWAWLASAAGGAAWVWEGLGWDCDWDRASFCWLLEWRMDRRGDTKGFFLSP